MKKKVTMLFLSLLILLSGCSPGSQKFGGEEKTSSDQTESREDETEAVDTLSGATISEEATEEEVLTYLKKILGEADKVMAVLTSDGIRTDENDSIEIELTGEESYKERYLRVTDEGFQSVADLKSLGKRLFTKEAYAEGFRFLVDEGMYGSNYYIEREGKLYVLASAPNGYFFTWDLDRGIEVAYAMKDRIVVYADAQEMHGDLFPGKIVLLREEGRWKLDSDVSSVYGLPFVAVEYQKQEDQEQGSAFWIDSPEKADEAAKDFLEGMIAWDEYFRDYDGELYAFSDGEGNLFQAIMLSLYEKRKDEPVPAAKIFLPINRKGYTPWMQSYDVSGRGILHIDSEKTGYDEDPDARFGYAVAEIPEDISWYEVAEDYKMSMHLMNNKIGGSPEEAGKLFFFIPRCYGTSIEWYDGEGGLLGREEDSFVILGLDDSIGKAVIRQGDFTAEFTPEIVGETRLQGGFITPYSYPASSR